MSTVTSVTHFSVAKLKESEWVSANKLYIG